MFGRARMEEIIYNYMGLSKMGEKLSLSVKLRKYPLRAIIETT